MQSQSHPQTMQNSLLHLLLATFSSSQYKFFWVYCILPPFISESRLGIGWCCLQLGQHAHDHAGAIAVSRSPFQEFCCCCTRSPGIAYQAKAAQTSYARTLLVHNHSEAT